MLAALRLREKANLNVRLMHSSSHGCQRRTGKHSQALWGSFTTAPDRSSVAPKATATTAATEATTAPAAAAAAATAITAAATATEYT